MTKLNSKTIGILFGLILLSAAAFYFFDIRGKSHNRTAENPPALKTVSQTKGSGLAQKKSDNLTAAAGNIKSPLPAYKGESPHILNGDPAIIAALGKDTADEYKKTLEDAAARLDAHPESYDDWIKVAYIKKLFKNYVGARDALEYATVVFPEYPLAYFNLATLYGFYLREPAKAEPNYLAAIQKDRTDVNQYTGLADFYVMIAKEPQKAENLILGAIKDLPADPNLVIYLASFYRDHGEKAKAVDWYKKALTFQIDSGQKQLIESEITDLQK